jgi:hypothetical protein
LAVRVTVLLLFELPVTRSLVSVPTAVAILLATVVFKTVLGRAKTPAPAVPVPPAVTLEMVGAVPDPEAVGFVKGFGGPAQSSVKVRTSVPVFEAETTELAALTLAKHGEVVPHWAEL